MNTNASPTLLHGAAVPPADPRIERDLAETPQPRLPNVRLRRRLWLTVQANDRWEALVAFILGMAIVAALAWAVGGFLGTRMP